MVPASVSLSSQKYCDAAGHYVFRRTTIRYAGRRLTLSIPPSDCGPATDVRASQAVLHVEGRTTRSPATWWWEYSTSQLAVQAGSGTQICGDPPSASKRCGPPDSYANPSQLVKGLTPDTTYYFRDCAQDAKGVACGVVRSFRTATVAQPGQLVVADSAAFSAHRNSGGIIRVDPATGAQTTITEGNNFVTPHGVTFDANGQILVVDRDAFGFQANAAGPGGVVRVDPRTGAQTVISRGGYFKTPVAIAVEADGNILVADDDSIFGDNNGAVIRVNPITGAQTVVSRGGYFVDPYGIAVQPNGDILVADQDAFPDGTAICGARKATNGRGGIIRVNPTTGAQTVVSAKGKFCDADGAELAPNGGLYVADLTAFGVPGGVICVNPATGTQYAISKRGDFSEPADVAIAPGGSVFVTDHDGKSPAGTDTPVVYKVDNATGAQTVLSYDGSFVRPEGIAVVPGSPPGPATTPCGR